LFLPSVQEGRAVDDRHDRQPYAYNEELKELIYNRGIAAAEETAERAPSVPARKAA